MEKELGPANAPFVILGGDPDEEAAEETGGAVPLDPDTPCMAINSYIKNHSYTYIGVVSGANIHLVPECLGFCCNIVCAFF